jgi:hypothetical protein
LNTESNFVDIDCLVAARMISTGGIMTEQKGALATGGTLFLAILASPFRMAFVFAIAGESRFRVNP